ncbi:MAG: hypothetical protein GY778_28825 [bacterium]|nr:hypothetical protein [bacterium]
MPQQTGPSAFSVTPDVETQLKDAGAVTASGAAQVAASDKVLDFGNITSGPAVEQVAYTRGDLVVDISALDFGSSDEFYQIVYQLSDDASGNGVGFDLGDTVVNKAVVAVGLAGGVAGSGADDDSEAPQRKVIGVDNEFDGDSFRFARLFTVVGGTTPSIDYTAFLTPNM